VKLDKPYIGVIRDDILAIEEYVHVGKQSFLAETMLQDAVSMRLIAIGENLNKLSEQFQNNHPEVPISQIVGLRNILAHGYGEVDMGRVWKVIEKDFVELSEIIKRIAEEMGVQE